MSMFICTNVTSFTIPMIIWYVVHDDVPRKADVTFLPSLFELNWALQKYLVIKTVSLESNHNIYSIEHM